MPKPVCRWYEPIDLRPGRPPLVRTTPETVSFEMPVLAGILRESLFVPSPRTRLLIHCDRDGTIVARILEGQTSGA